MDSQDWGWEECHAEWMVIWSAEHLLLGIVLAYVVWLTMSRQTQHPDPNTVPHESGKCTCYQSDKSPLCLGKV